MLFLRFEPCKGTLMKLSEVAIQRPVFAFMMNLVIVIFGLFSYPKMGVDMFPNVDFPVVIVSAYYPNGGDPGIVEQKLLKVMEEHFQGLQGLDKFQTRATPHLAVAVLEFKLSIDINKAVQDVRDKVSLIRDDTRYPKEARAPLVQRFDLNGEPVVSLVLHSKNIPLSELSRLADDIIKPRLEQVKGVGAVSLVGARKREIQALLNRSAMQSFGLSPLEIVSRVSKQLGEYSSGELDNQKEVIRLKTLSIPKSQEEIARIVLPTYDGTFLRLENIAFIQDALAEEKTYAQEGQNLSVLISVNKETGQNPVFISKQIHKVFAELKKELPLGAELKIYHDSSTYINGSINSVLFDLLFGCLLAILIVLIFIQNYRMMFICACTLPVALLGSIAVMEKIGFTLNTMTTLGLTLAIGLLIDDAIVVIENVSRHLKMGKNSFQAAKDATKEISLAVIAITLVILAVFVPVAFMDGIIGRFFFSFGMTIAVAVIFSFFVSFTLTPMLASQLFAKQEEGPVHGVLLFFRRAIEALTRWYSGILEKSLFYKKTTVLVGVFCFFLSAVLLVFVPKSFFPTEDKGLFSVVYTLKAETSISETKKRSLEIVHFLQNYPEFENVVLNINKENEAHISLFLLPKNKRNKSQAQLMEIVRDDLKKKFPLSSDEQLSLEKEGHGDGHSQPIQLELRSPNYEELLAFAKTFKEYVEKDVPFVTDVIDTAPKEINSLTIRTDLSRATDLEVSTYDIAQTLQALFGFEGQKVGELEENGIRYDIKMKIDKNDATNLHDIYGIHVATAKNQLVPLSSVSVLEESKSLAEINRSFGQRNFSIFANFSGKDLSAALTQIENHLKATKPDSVSYRFSGEAELMGDAIKGMLMAALLALILVYMVLCAQFESFLIPFIIMMSVPLAFSGAFLATLVTHTVMSIYTMIGLILLMGLVTKNGILMIDFALEKVRNGMTPENALREAAPLRFKPVVMTTCAMIFSMLPIAIGHGTGGEARAPMAIAIIGGLISSTILTLVVIPVLFSLLVKSKGKKENSI